MKIVGEIEEIINKLKFIQRAGIIRMAIQLAFMILITLVLGYILGIMSAKFILFTLISSIAYLLSLIIKVLSE